MRPFIGYANMLQCRINNLMATNIVDRPGQQMKVDAMVDARWAAPVHPTALPRPAIPRHLNPTPLHCNTQVGIMG